MQPQQESVEGWVIPGGRGDVEDLLKAQVGQCRASAAQPARFGNASRGVLALGQDAVGDRMFVQAPERGDQVLGCAAAAAGISPGDHGCLDVLGELADVRGGHVGDGPGTPCLDHAVPVGAVHPAGSAADRTGNTRNVFSERRRSGDIRGCADKVGGVDAHLVQQHARRFYLIGTRGRGAVVIHGDDSLERMPNDSGRACR